MLFIIIQFSSHIRIYTYCVKESPLSLTPRKTKKPSRMQYRGKAIDFSENKCWIPPGFRGRSIPFKILSALLYSMLVMGLYLWNRKAPAARQRQCWIGSYPLSYSSPLYCSLETGEDSGDIYLYLIAWIEQKGYGPCHPSTYSCGSDNDHIHYLRKDATWVR